MLNEQTCNCCKCSKNNNPAQDFTLVLWDTNETYNGQTPFSIIAVLNASLKLQAPDALMGKGFNEAGYVENYFASQIADYSTMYLARAEKLAVDPGYFALLLVYNSTK